MFCSGLRVADSGARVEKLSFDLGFGHFSPPRNPRLADMLGFRTNPIQGARHPARATCYEPKHPGSFQQKSLQDAILGDQMTNPNPIPKPYTKPQPDNKTGPVAPRSRTAPRFNLFCTGQRVNLHTKAKKTLNRGLDNQSRIPFTGFLVKGLYKESTVGFYYHVGLHQCGFVRGDEVGPAPTFWVATLEEPQTV